MFIVKAKNLATGKEEQFQVTRNSIITSQQDAEDHIANLPKSVGGTHAGYEVIPAAPEAAHA